jgi:integrase
MAQTIKSKLSGRTERLRLPVNERHYQKIEPGVALCYRRGPKGAGTWSVRLKLASGRYVLELLGYADDHSDGDGANGLKFAEAQRKALAKRDESRADDGSVNRKLTVSQASERYLEWFRAHRKGIAMAESAVRTHILPALGDRAAAKLSTAEIRTWLESLAATPARLRTSKFAGKANTRPAKTNDAKRARKATANRVYTVLRAILNKAFQDGAVADDSAWRKVKPFPKVDEAKIRYLTDAESVRLVNACPRELRALVRAALLTGARWGELAALRVADVTTSRKQPSVYVAESKSGKPRHIPLNPEGRELFASLVAGKVADALVFVRPDGDPWRHNDHVRALTEACRVAKVRPAVSFHELRHTYASHLAQAGVPLLTIAKLLGHADTRITARHYAHLADKTLADAVTNLPSFLPDSQSVLVEVPATRVA